VPVKPTTWQQVADPILKQALRELAEAQEAAVAPRGFLAYRAADLTIGAPTTALVPMDGTLWNARPGGPSTAGEYQISPTAPANAFWAPTKPGVPWLVFAGVRANVASGVYGQLELVDLNAAAPVVARLAEQVPAGNGILLSGAAVIIPTQGQRLSIRLDVSAWAGGIGIVSGGASSSKPARSYWGAVCLDP